jgi:Cu-Zn family superoxide dismutase
MDMTRPEIARGRAGVGVAALLCSLLCLAGCGRESGAAATGPARVDPFAGIGHAVAVLEPTAGNKVRGVVRIDDVPGGAKVTADLEGLEPGSKHAIHIHEFGDVTAPDGTSAGGHYNPEGYPHALPPAEKRHAGDLGNLEADASGKAHLEITVRNFTVAGPKNPVLGRAVVVHAKADDGSQPTGNAGARIACGVLGVAK